MSDKASDLEEKWNSNKGSLRKENESPWRSKVFLDSANLRSSSVKYCSISHSRTSSALEKDKRIHQIKNIEVK